MQFRFGLLECVSVCWGWGWGGVGWEREREKKRRGRERVAAKRCVTKVRLFAWLGYMLLFLLQVCKRKKKTWERMNNRLKERKKDKKGGRQASRQTKITSDVTKLAVHSMFVSSPLYFDRSYCVCVCSPDTERVDWSIMFRSYGCKVWDT